MKIFLNIILCGLLISACSKKIEFVNEQYPLIDPLRIDSNAGTWKPLLLSTQSEFLAATPIAINSPDYILQLNEVKSFQRNLNNEDRSLVNYWGAGAVLRWNEIMRELVAKHNLPPIANADGSYPVPSANNPLAYPTFPFSNPPYAARAFAYLSAAQYDACISTYYNKAVFRRAAPYNNDAGISALLPKTPISSYPSEDAAVMASSVAILKLMFPGDQDYIVKRAEEHKRARLLAGMNVRSDLDAGEQIGMQVAAKFITKARNDKANLAVGNPTVWAQQKAACVTRGEVPWESLEIPARPGMLPLFGQVKAWMFDSAALVNTIRPVAPPSTSSQSFKDELNEIYLIQKNLSSTQSSIANFWADGVGSITPPGHWNYIAANEFAYLQFSEARWARNMALINISLMDAAIACWDAKYYYYSPRPSQMDSRIKSVTGVPNFPAYISGHSTFSGAASTVLAYIVPNKSAKFFAMALEASESRKFGAIHYNSDCKVGIETGNKIGLLAIDKGRVDGAN